MKKKKDWFTIMLWCITALIFAGFVAGSVLLYYYVGVPVRIIK